MSSSRAWLFRILIIIAASLMVWSWFMPWWSVNVPDLNLDNAVVIHPWGLEQNLGSLAAYISGSSMPDWFAPIMWTYLGLCIAALLFSLFAGNKEINLWKIKTSLPAIITGLVGLSYIVVVLTAVIFASIRMGDFYNTNLIGSTKIEIMEAHPVYVYSNLRTGYWLACGAGPLLVVLSLLRNKITGKPVSVVK